MKVAISGASGLIGSALVPALATAGHEVVRLVRREPASPDEIAWDPAAGTIDAAALTGVDAFVSLSGANLDRRWTKANKAEILESRVQATELLARTAAALQPRPSAFVGVVGTGIYGDRGDEVLTEASELGSGFLAGVARANEAAAEPAREAGIRVVDLRQGFVLTRRGGALARMLTPFRLGVGGRVGNGRQWWSWIALDDSAAGFRYALESDLEGRVNLTSPNPVPNVHFVKALGRALHRPTVFPLPELAVKAVFGEKGDAMLLEGQRLLPARLLEAGFAFRYPDLDSALARALER
jgi:uncharacterized protein (TIGR01777 family)